MSTRLRPVRSLPLVCALGFALASAPVFPAPAAGADEVDAAEPEDAAAAEPAVDPAAEKFWQALKSFRSTRPEDLAAGRRLLQEAADAEFVPAQALLGNCHLTGSYGFARDERKGASLFRLAAERGEDFAKVSYGQCLFAGTGVRKDLDKAAAWLEAAVAPTATFARPTPPDWFVAEDADKAEADDAGVAGELETDPVGSARASAHFLLGLIAQNRGDLGTAQNHFVAAANAGPAGRSGIYPAAVQAALNYAFGLGVPRDTARARELLDHSRELNRRIGVAWVHSPVAMKVIDEFAVADLEETIAAASAGEQASLQMKIAATFADRTSRDYNVQEAVRWYEVAAENDQPWAMLSLGLIYSRGELGTPDPERAYSWFEKAGGGEKPKHLLAAANLAICYFNGLGTAKDATKAAAIFARHRNEDMVCYLGSIGQCPPAPLYYEEVLALNQTWAKEKKDPHAQFLLGLRHLHGWGVKEDEKRARRWLTLAADAGDARACGRLGELYRLGPDRDPKKALACYTKGLAGKDAVSAFGMGALIEFRLGLPFDWQQAVGYYEQALELDPTMMAAHERLAGLYGDRVRGIDFGPPVRDGRGGWTQPVRTIVPTDDDRQRLLHHLTEASRLGSGWAALRLAERAYNGKGEPQDFRKAYTLFETAAEHGNNLAHFFLGQMHENGDGVPVTLTEAAYHYRLAALEGNLDALKRLAEFYLTGRGVSEDLDRASFWLFKLAQQGETDALITLGDVAVRKGDYRFALKWFRQLDDTQNPQLAAPACVRLSRCYELGLGAKASPGRARSYREKAVRLGGPDVLYRAAGQLMLTGSEKEAVALYEKAADSSGAACFALGQMYYFGTHVEKDPPKAWTYLRRAAQTHLRDALFFLAAATANGEPGAPSLEESLAFAREAEAAGHPKAAVVRRKLEARQGGGAPGAQPGAVPATK